MGSLQGRTDKAKLKLWYKLATMSEDRYPRRVFSQDWDAKPRRGRLRKVWSRLVFVALDVDKAEWLEENPLLVKNTCASSHLVATV